MSFDTLRQAAKNNIELSQKQAREGKDFTPATVMESKRMLEILDYIVPEISPMEWSRLMVCGNRLGLFNQESLSSCKDIKERHGLSWNELILLCRNKGGTSEAQKRATAKYQANNYEFIKVRMNKGQKDIIKKEAKEKGMSLNSYILEKLGLNQV